MKVYQSVTIDMLTGMVLAEDSCEWDEPVEYLKGGGEAKAITKEQLALEKQAFALQKQQMDKINAGFDKYLGGAIGYSPEDLAAMRSQFLNSQSQGFSQAGQAVYSGLLRRGSGGGDQPVGGDFTRGLEGLQGLNAATTSQGLLGINVANAQQKISNAFNAGSLISGNAAMLGNDVASFTSGTSSALNSYIQAVNQGFWPSFASGLGGNLAKVLTGGVGGMIFGSGPPK